MHRLETTWMAESSILDYGFEQISQPNQLAIILNTLKTFIHQFVRSQLLLVLTVKPNKLVCKPSILCPFISK